TVEEIARSVKAELDSNIALEVVGQFIARRVGEIYAQSKFKALRRYGELVIPSAIGANPSIPASPSAGTVTVTPGSQPLTGDSTDSSVWSTQLAGWFFRVYPLKTWYRIARLDPPSTITLDSPVSTERNINFLVGTPLSGQSYHIIQKYIPLASDVRYPGVFV